MDVTSDSVQDARQWQVEPKPVSMVHNAQWRLFTRHDFDMVFGQWQTSGDHSYFPGIAAQGDHRTNARAGHVHADTDAIQTSIGRLKGLLNRVHFEHGHEGEIPRANIYRAYRLTAGQTVLAIVALRASEAFNLCEVDVFLTAETAEIGRLESTRAALLFAFSDAVKNGGSMAVQFTRECAPAGVPAHVRQLAAHVKVPLQREHAARGSLSPDEVRALYLRLSGLPAAAQHAAGERSAAGDFSIERICYLAAHGIWSPHEIAMLVCQSPFAGFLLGEGVSVLDRHLYASAMAHGRTAILNETLHRVLAYVPARRLGEDTVCEWDFSLTLGSALDGAIGTCVYEPLPAPRRLVGWSFDGGKETDLPAHRKLLAVLRPRPHVEQRVFMLQDIDAAVTASRSQTDTAGLLVLAADSRQLPQSERAEARRYALERGIDIVTSPLSVSSMDAELRHRMVTGKAVRP